MKIACVQANVVFGDPLTNAQRAVRELERLNQAGVDLAVFPEAFLTGYCVDSAEGASQIAIASDAAVFDELAEASTVSGVTTILGFAETDGDYLYNSAALLEPNVAPRFYRKSHLPELGLDNFVRPGDDLTVFDTHLGRIGILICFDMRHPEPTRTLALRGAELIVLPTNWPEGAETSAQHVAITRSAENRVFFAACNRVGTENGFNFIGQSKILDVTGVVLAAAGSDEETIMAEVDLAAARNKRNVNIPGKYETTVFDSRRPELYGTLVEPTSVSSLER